MELSGAKDRGKNKLVTKKSPPVWLPNFFCLKIAQKFFLWPQKIPIACLRESARDARLKMHIDTGVNINDNFFLFPIAALISPSRNENRFVHVSLPTPARSLDKYIFFF